MDHGCDHQLSYFTLCPSSSPSDTPKYPLFPSQPWGCRSSVRHNWRHGAIIAWEVHLTNTNTNISFMPDDRIILSGNSHVYLSMAQMKAVPPSPIDSQLGGNKITKTSHPMRVTRTCCIDMSAECKVNTHRVQLTIGDGLIDRSGHGASANAFH